MNSWQKESQKKIIGPNRISRLVKNLREQGKTIATLNGSFDLLHAGHLDIIYKASQLADVLIVALNSDVSIKKYKDRSKPILPLKHRLSLVAALEFVDYVTFFSEEDPRCLLGKIRPDVHINGKEYGKDCIERKTIKKMGGKIYLVGHRIKLSTSDIITRIKKCER